jgi:muconolactone D-isomerase
MKTSSPSTVATKESEHAPFNLEAITPTVSCQSGWLAGTSHFGKGIMLYLVRMDVHLPHDMPAAQADEIKAREKAYSQELQRQGKWRQLHRVVGLYANYSVFDVESLDDLHAILSGLPLFPFMTMKVTALAHHPSSIC